MSIICIFVYAYLSVCLSPVGWECYGKRRLYGWVIYVHVDKMFSLTNTLKIKGWTLKEQHTKMFPTGCRALVLFRGQKLEWEPENRRKRGKQEHQEKQILEKSSVTFFSTPFKRKENKQYRVPPTFPPLSIVSWTFFRKSLSLHLFESRMVVAYVDSEMRMSGRHLSIHAALQTYNMRMKTEHVRVSYRRKHGNTKDHLP